MQGLGFRDNFPGFVGGRFNRDDKASIRGFCVAYGFLGFWRLGFLL